MLPPNSGRGEDCIAWRLSNDGGFSNKSAYESLLHHNPDSRQKLFNLIWSWPGPERGKVLLWKVSHEALVTNLFRWKRGLSGSSDCPLCGREVETILHLMRDCVCILQVWNFLAENNLPSDFTTDDLDSWLLANLSEEASRRGFKWRVLFGVTLMVVWQARNELIFHG